MNQICLLKRWNANTFVVDVVWSHAKTCLSEEPRDKQAWGLWLTTPCALKTPLVKCTDTPHSVCAHCKGISVWDAETFSLTWTTKRAQRGMCVYGMSEEELLLPMHHHCSIWWRNPLTAQMQRLWLMSHLAGWKNYPMALSVDFFTAFIINCLVLGLLGGGEVILQNSFQ